MTGNELKQAVLAAIQEHTLDMSRWRGQDTLDEHYPCGTACCLAGWIVNCYLGGGKLLDACPPTGGRGRMDAFGSPVPSLAKDILGRLGLQYPDFMNGTEADAMAWLNEQPVA